MKKALIVATVVGFIAGFEKNDIKILQNLGYQVHYAANCDVFGNEKMLSDLNSMGVVKHHIPFARNPLNKNNISAYKMLSSIIKNEKFDIIHCHTPVGGVLTRIAARKFRKKGTKVIYTAHGFHFFKGAPIKNWLLYYPVEWFYSFFTDEIITINKEDYARAQNHMHAKHFTYIPGVGVDTKKFSPKLLTNQSKKDKLKELGIPDNKFILLSVGELQDRKNHIVVINALSELKNANIIYLIAGVGELYDKYQEIIERSGMSDSIRLLGYRTDVKELCEISDCFVHPSIREGLGIAPLEAMACGLPLISSNINGIKDYTEDGETGCCVNPKSVEEMKAAILKMNSDSEFRKKCGIHNISVADRFSIEKTNQIMKELYKNMSIK